MGVKLEPGFDWGSQFNLGLKIYRFNHAVLIFPGIILTFLAEGVPENIFPGLKPERVPTPFGETVLGTGLFPRADFFHGVYRGFNF